MNNADAYVPACVAGLGLIAVPESTLDDDFRAKRLVEVLPLAMPVHLLFPHRRQLSLRVRVFLDWLEAVIQNCRGSAPPLCQKR
ncbi:MAG: LysR substrate-binding domain-containing protein [Myxococcota bacterium]